MRNRFALGNMAFTFINGLFMLVVGIATLYPFWNIAAIAFNDSMDSLRGGIYLWPRQFTWNNFEIIFSNDQLFHSAFNSLLRTVVGTVIGVLCAAMLAYTLSRREFVLRKSFNSTLMISMYVNGGLIPTYILIKNLGLTNHFIVYLLPGLVSAFNIIIVRSYFDGLPEALVESARIDGANDTQILFRILFAISLPVLSTIALFTAVSHWNSWFDNYLYVSNVRWSLLQYELMKILTSSVNEVTANAAGHIDGAKIKSTTPESLRAAMTITVTVPILFVYPFLQKYFIKGVTIGAVKE